MIYVPVCLIKMLNLVAHSPCQQRNFYDLHIYSTLAQCCSVFHKIGLLDIGHASTKQKGNGKSAPPLESSSPSIEQLSCAFPQAAKLFKLFALIVI